MSIEAARLRVDVQADTDKASAELQKFGGEVDGGGKKGLGGAFGAASLAAKAFAGTAIAAMAGKTIMAASDLNEVLSKAGVVFGPSTDVVVANADRMAKSFGIPKAEMLDAAAGIGLLGEAAGVTGKPLTDMSLGLSNLAADASSFYNVPITQALDDFKSGLSGESEPLKKYGVLLNEAAVKTQAMKMGLVGANGEVSEGAKVQARAALITEGLAKANGDLERTQDSVSNRLREVKGRLTNAMAAIGTVALPAVSALLGALISAGVGVGNFLQTLGPPLKTAFGAAKEAVMALWAQLEGPAKTAFAMVQTGWGVLTDAFGRGKAIVLDVIAGIREVIGGMSTDEALGMYGGKVVGFVDGVRTAFTIAKDVISGFVTQAGAFLSSPAMSGALASLSGAFQGLLPPLKGLFDAVMNNKILLGVLAGVFLLVVAPIPVLIAAFVAAYAKVEWFRNMVNTLVTFFIGTLIPTLLAVVGAVIGFATDVVKWIGPMIATLIEKFQSFVKFIVPLIEDAFTIIKAVFSAWKTFVLPVIQAALSIIGTLFSTTFGVIKDVVAVAFGMIKATISATFGIIGGIVKAALALLTGDFSGAWEGIKKAAGAAFGLLKYAVSEGLGGVVRIVGELPGRALSALGDIGGALKGAGGKLISGFINGIKDKFGDVKDTLGNLTGKLTSWKGPPQRDATILRGAGKLVIQGFVRGIDSQRGAVKAALGRITRDVAGTTMAGPNVPAVGLQAKVFTDGGVRPTPVAVAGPRDADGADGAASQTAAGKTVTVNVTNYYPVAEPTSVTLNRGLQLAAAVGV